MGILRLSNSFSALAVDDDDDDLDNSPSDDHDNLPSDDRPCSSHSDDRHNLPSDDRDKLPSDQSDDRPCSSHSDDRHNLPSDDRDKLPSDDRPCSSPSDATVGVSDAGENRSRLGSSSDMLGGTSSDKLEVENGSTGDQKSGVSVLKFRRPLVWIDLEMTGLDVEVDRILEIACIITDANLEKLVEMKLLPTKIFLAVLVNISAIFAFWNLMQKTGKYWLPIAYSSHLSVALLQGPTIVIHQSSKCLSEMSDWCKDNHGNSGLTEKVCESEISEREAEKEVIEFVEKHVVFGTHPNDQPHLAGNSVYTDYIFLKKYMPELAKLFPHVLVDVSSVAALCIRWYPAVKKKAPKKSRKHRAMDDIKESIRELKYYKDNIFIAPQN